MFLSTQKKSHKQIYELVLLKAPEINTISAWLLDITPWKLHIDGRLWMLVSKKNSQKSLFFVEIRRMQREKTAAITQRNRWIFLIRLAIIKSPIIYHNDSTEKVVRSWCAHSFCHIDSEINVVQCHCRLLNISSSVCFVRMARTTTTTAAVVVMAERRNGKTQNTP